MPMGPMGIEAAPLPPSLSGQAPFGASPASMPLGNPGDVAAGVAKVRESINILQMALPQFPVGTPIHKSVLKAITDLSKLAPEAEAAPGQQQTVLADIMRMRNEQAPMVSAMRAMGAEQPDQAAAAAAA